MISGYFQPGSDWPLPYVRALLWLPTVRPRWTPIELLIDTGAAYTSLHPLDAIRRVGIPAQTLSEPALWPKHETPAGIGGSALYFVVEAHYAFEQDDGSWHQIAGEIRIAHAAASNLGPPSILGWDLLRQFPIEMDWSTRTVALG